MNHTHQQKKTFHASLHFTLQPPFLFQEQAVSSWKYSVHSLHYINEEIRTHLARLPTAMWDLRWHKEEISLSNSRTTICGEVRFWGQMLSVHEFSVWSISWLCDRLPTEFGEPEQTTGKQAVPVLGTGKKPLTRVQWSMHCCLLEEAISLTSFKWHSLAYKGIAREFLWHSKDRGYGTP